MPGKFELKRTRDGKYMFNLLASNGEVVLTSQRYATKHGAKNGITSVVTNAPTETRFQQKAAKSGQEYFVLKGANGRVVGQSEQYTSRRSMLNGIKSVRKNATKARINDLTK